MHIIKPRTVREYERQHPDAGASLEDWLIKVKAAKWDDITDVRQTFNRADPVVLQDGETVTVFNISDNKYRLITTVRYRKKKVFALMFLTHAEYSRETWKGQLCKPR
jgi:mRNA interferase HigB